MRTKHFLFSMALGVAVVACSENELATVQENANDAKLSVRPVVDTEITLNDEGADTRFDIGTGARPVWSTNDKIGAAIIDVPTYNGAADYGTKLTAASGDVSKLYNIVEAYGCNNAFSTTDGGATWAAEHPMVEGNYLFYAPYNEDMALRSPLTVAVPKLQDASSEKSALSEFYKSGSVVQLGYKFITGTDKKTPTNIKMFNIFAYPKFTIKNDFNGYLFDNATSGAIATAKYNGKIKVDSIQFVNVNAAQAAITTTQIGGKLTHSDQTSAPASSATAGVVKQMANTGDWNNVDKLLASVTTNSLLNTSDDKVTVGRGISSLGGVITTLKVGREIEQGKAINVYCVMPAMKFNFTANQLVAKIFVTINDVQYEIYQAALAQTNKDSWTASDVKLNAAATNKGYLFNAAGNPGLESLSFMAGQSYPSEALRVDANGNYALKTGVNNLLEIKLIGGEAKKTGVSDNLQVAVRKGATNNGIATTDDLITLIENGANGTKWVEGATDSETAKGFNLAPVNSVEINAALINALAKNNQNSGSFKLTTSVLPVANDVVLGDIDGATNGAKFVTFVTANGNSAKVDLDDAVVADNKYILVSTALTTVTSDKNTVILVEAGGSLTMSADLTAKSLVVAPAILDAAGTISTAAGIVSVANNKLTAANINNYGTMTVGAVAVANILNANALTVNGAIATADNKDPMFTNNGTITTGNVAAKFKVSAGKGTIVLPSTTASSAILVDTKATQEVIYDVTGAVATQDIKNAAAIPAVTTIKAGGAITLEKAGIAEFGSIRRIIAGANITAAIAEEIDLTGFTLVLSSNIKWIGANVNTSSVKGLAVEAGNKVLTLDKVKVVNGTFSAVKGGGISADGITSYWNGGASAPLQ